MSVNFEYRSGILEAGDPATDTEWCWYKGDTLVVKSMDGVIIGSLEVAPDASVNDVKAAIRLDAKPKK